MNTETNQPITTFREGSIKAAIWKRPGKDGKPPFYSVTITRSYKDQHGKWHESSSFSGTELFVVSQLASIAYSKICDLREADRAAAGSSS